MTCPDIDGTEWLRALADQEHDGIDAYSDHEPDIEDLPARYQ